MSKLGPWIICPTCGGEGKHSRALGSFTREEFDRDFTYEEQEAYIDGAYDQICGTCSGSGKVREHDENAWANHARALAYDRHGGRFNDAGEPLW